MALAGAAAPVLAQTKWDLPAAYPASNFHTENLVQFAGDVDKATGGKLKITVHANASLFKAPEIKRAVQGGQAQIGEILLANFQNEWQIFGADGLPFLADSYDESAKLYKAQKPALEKKLGEQGMMLLYAVPWGPQGIYVKKPIASAADLKGVKWRAYSPATARIAELVGAQPVTVQAAELSQAMATGVVESYMSSGATGYDTKTYEHIKYWYDTQAWLPKNAVIVNKAAFDALDAPSKQALLEGRRRRRSARVVRVEGEEPRVPRPAEEEWHEHRRTQCRFEERHEEGRRHHAQGMAGKGRPRRPGRCRRLQKDVMPAAPDRPALLRRILDNLYDGAAGLAALFMVGLLIMVLLSIFGRQLHFNVPGVDAYAGYMMAAAGFLAMAHTLKQGEHIRVTLLVARLAGAWKRRLELWALFAACGLSALMAFYSCRLAWQSRAFHDISTGNDATPLWIPQLSMAVGGVVLAIAFIDEFVLEWRGMRVEHVSSEAMRNE